MPKTEPYLLDLSYRGFIEGQTYLSSETNEPLCRYFGGLPYALPPIGPYRWRQARALPACYRYGTRNNPGRFTGGAALCPQPGFMADPDETLWDEDCLQLNIWVPVGEQPDKGWPVLLWIHGGWLQFGTPNETKLTSLLGETNCQCIVVCPAYRLNLIGFLASQEIEEEAQKNNEHVGNFGFWDQRLALEWTHKNVSYFGGNAANITVAGLSAGAHSTFHQLSHDIFLPAHCRLIRRACMISNGAGMQPKSLPASQPQFDSLLTALSIPLTLSGPEKLSKLRALPARTLIAATTKIPFHEFRSCSDGTFVRKHLFADIDSGAYATKLEEAGVHLIIGEVRDEHFLYGAWRAPKTQSLNAVRARLCAEYPESAVAALLEKCYCPDGKLPTNTWPECKEWTPDAFGRIYSDLQVHALERGFIDRLIKGGVADRVHRYRIEFRAKCADDFVPPEWGVTHATDIPLWFYGNGDGEVLTKSEKEVAGRFCAPAWAFFQGIEGWEKEWGADAARGEARLLRSDGSVGVWKDGDFERGVKVWDVVRKACKKDEEGNDAKL